jgi:hypothetical protein
MTVPQGQVIERIAMAFKDVAYPGDQNITDGHSVEAHQVASLLRGKRWSDIDIELLQQYDEVADLSSLPFFLSPAAFHYYLPAFLTVTLSNPREFGMLADTLVSTLGPVTNAATRDIIRRATARTASLTDDQTHCVIEYLRYLRSLHASDKGLNDGISAALERWE